MLEPDDEVPHLLGASRQAVAPPIPQDPDEGEAHCDAHLSHAEALQAYVAAADTPRDVACTLRPFDQVNAAGLRVGGWFDIFSQGTIDAFVGYQHEGGPGARIRQKLVVPMRGRRAHTSAAIPGAG